MPVHLALQEHQVHGLTVLEDSGEMVAMSLLASYAVRMWEQQGAGAGELWRLTSEAALSRKRG